MTAHGITFHHFVGHGHPFIQGAVDEETFVRILRFVGTERILPAGEWRRRALAGTLGDDDLCLTFDDNLQCQIDVAVPVLESMGLTAFWFLYSAPLAGVLGRLEVYRYFRNVAFNDVDVFYDAFDRAIEAGPWADAVATGLRGVDTDSYMKEFDCHSPSDRRFRYLRDRILGPDAYNETMDSLVATHGFDVDAISQAVFMDVESVRRLADAGHVVGLHSHSHPVNVTRLTAEEQRAEYRECKRILEAVIGTTVDSMAHPSGSYDERTLRVLAELGIHLGFRADMAMTEHGPLEFPRVDHSALTARLAPA